MAAYIGEIRMFAGTFAPAGWAICDGRSLLISEYDALYTLIGTLYGGDGTNNFNLPDLRGRVPVHMKTVSGGLSYQIGEMAGVESVTLTTQQIPVHNHAVVVSTATADSTLPTNSFIGKSNDVDIFYEDNPNQNMNPGSISPIGGSQPHDNMQPYLCINFIISLEGIFPTQS
ncbi:phage tail protein [Telluribacter humicola]|uniref:phage tail protein n=1 Tax=Telluribacter humicola TaxID=1720261 RepID=UPI001E4E6404|nr:tail fiber protein [Telluribacter humicola]